MGLHQSYHQSWGGDHEGTENEKYIPVGILQLASYQPYQNVNSRLEFGSAINYALIKTITLIIKLLMEGAIYKKFKTLSSLVMD